MDTSLVVFKQYQSAATVQSQDLQRTESLNVMGYLSATVVHMTLKICSTIPNCSPSGLVSTFLHTCIYLAYLFQTERMKHLITYN